jgi:hypothetical protein
MSASILILHDAQTTPRSTATTTPLSRAPRLTPEELREIEALMRRRRIEDALNNRL